MIFKIRFFIYLLPLVIISCLEKSVEISSFEESGEINMKNSERIFDSLNIKLNYYHGLGYNHRSDLNFIEYFTIEEKDSINKLIPDSKTLKKFEESDFYTRILHRRLIIMGILSGLQNHSYKGTYQHIPRFFRRYFSNEELINFSSDSISHLVRFYELAKCRKKKVSTFFNNSRYYYEEFLQDDELALLIKGNFRDSIYFRELVANRYKKDSTESAIKFNRRKDSLQSIVHPIDSILPFGPKPLGKLIKKNKSSLSFYLRKEGSVAEEQIQNRKDIYEIWMYFLKFHPYADAELSDDDYEEKILPPIKDYQFIDFGIELSDEHQAFDPSYAQFQARLSNIGRYEVYYSTTGFYGNSYGCSIHSKAEENCCFATEGYNCNSVGYFILYDRKKEHSTIIPAFVLKKTQSYGFQLQFSYIKDNTIYVFEGRSMYDWFVTKDGDISRYLEHDDGSTIGAEGYKSVGIAKTYKIEVFENGEIKKITY